MKSLLGRLIGNMHYIHINGENTSPRRAFESVGLLPGTRMCASLKRKKKKTTQPSFCTGWAAGGGAALFREQPVPQLLRLPAGYSSLPLGMAGWCPGMPAPKAEGAGIMDPVEILLVGPWQGRGPDPQTHQAALIVLVSSLSGLLGPLSLHTPACPGGASCSTEGGTQLGQCALSSPSPLSRAVHILSRTELLYSYNGQCKTWHSPRLLLSGASWIKEQQLTYTAKREH